MSDDYAILNHILPDISFFTDLGHIRLRSYQLAVANAVTDSIVMRSRSGTVRRITAQQSIEKLSALTGFEYR